MDYYRILDVSWTATPREIKKAYHKLALVHHPDKNPNDEEEATKQFQIIGKAFQVLSNEEQRAKYNYENRRKFLCNSWKFSPPANGTGKPGSTKPKSTRNNNNRNRTSPYTAQHKVCKKCGKSWDSHKNSNSTAFKKNW